MSNPNEELLAKLHTATIKLLLDKVIAGEASSGELAVAVKLLKDNGINCDLKVQPDLKKLATLTTEAFKGEQDNDFN